MKNLLQRFLYMAATAVVLWFFSEFYFWSMIRPDFTVLGHVNTYRLYLAATYVTFCVASIFRVRSLWALFLAGGVYGWLIEAVMVSTTYDNFPYHIAWTGLCWHALISVVFGWYVIRKQLVKDSYPATIGVSLVTGAFWIAWSSWWWMDDPENQVWTSNALFAQGTFVFMLFPSISYWILGKIPARVLKTTVWELLVVLAFVAYWFFGGTMHTIDPPSRIWIAPVVFGVTLLLLWKNRRDEWRPDVMEETAGRVAFRQVVLFYLLTSTTATIGYILCHRLNTSAPVNEYVYWTTIPVSAMLYLVSAAMVLVRKGAGEGPQRDEGPYANTVQAAK